MITAELIQRFFRDECNHEEAEAVAAYFREHPEMLTVYFNHERWHQLESGFKLAPAISGKMLDVIQQARKQQRNTRLRKYMAVAVGIAAVTIGVIFTLPMLLTTSPAKREVATIIQAPAPVLQTVHHEGPGTRAVRLADGSLITLEAHSTLQYYVPFESHQRTLWMKGEAHFDIHRQADKPMVVYAGGMGTWVLGTTFRIKTMPEKREVKVLLLTGKVIVKAADPALKGKLRDITLSPGQQLKVNTRQLKTQVSHIHTAAKVAAPVPAPAGINSSVTMHAEKITFNYVPLPEVFAVMEKEYHIIIKGDRERLQKKFFTGDISRTDAVLVILGNIALLNNIKVDQDTTGNYIIHQ